MEQLSKSEKQIMNSFWNSTSPLTANDLLSVCIGRTWKTRSVFPLVKKLLEKGFYLRLALCAAERLMRELLDLQFHELNIGQKLYDKRI